jgi:two-component system, chemotaxis family, response regulator Rcp1
MNNQLADSRPMEVLLVEDNLSDVQLMRHGFTTSKLLLNLHHVWDGEQCLNFLRKQGQYFNAPTPDLILLDLNMPRMGGREVLMEMLADDNLSHLPVVVLTASAQDRETFQMYKLRCSSYIVKPIDFDQFLQVIGTIANYWFTVVVLPPSVERAKSHAGA